MKKRSFTTKKAIKKKNYKKQEKIKKKPMKSIQKECEEESLRYMEKRRLRRRKQQHWSMRVDWVRCMFEQVSYLECSGYQYGIKDYWKIHLKMWFLSAKNVKNCLKGAVDVLPLLLTSLHFYCRLWSCKDSLVALYFWSLFQSCPFDACNCMGTHQHMHH